MRVLVLTLSFGSGHVRAAQAVAEELAQQAPGADVRVIDALEHSRLLFRACYVWPYWAMVRYVPFIWDRFYRARVTRMDQHTAPTWTLRWGCPQVFKTIAEFKPQVIIAAEVAACEMAVMAKRAGLTQARVVNAITDYEAEPVWVKPEVDVYAVADEGVSAQLRSWGAAAGRIIGCGIPTAASFSEPHNKKATLARYGLRNDVPMVLLMGGGMGPTHMNEVAALLCKADEPMQIVAITGRDTRMRRKLERLRAKRPVSLCVLGWVDDVAALMQAASLLVTKPGGLTTAEAAVCGLPVVMFDAIPGPEQRNAARLTACGAGLLTRNAQETVAATLSLLRDDHMRHRMYNCAARLARPKAAETIARLAIGDLMPVRPMARRTTA